MHVLLVARAWKLNVQFVDRMVIILNLFAFDKIYKIEFKTKTGLPHIAMSTDAESFVRP